MGQKPSTAEAGGFSPPPPVAVTNHEEEIFPLTCRHRAEVGLAVGGGKTTAFKNTEIDENIFGLP